ncbi:hypothetical protein [Bradyrhizobium sp. AUGA SZCCT0042]|uniref:hypothetical protein n=1 Tax=Bradyrhizobium sp. AUGA SZCCT0042 TaxID=2807651 RepID=UPI001BA590C2|nr:hypothetical protein [Bradyrhizobium sp. AUGA SZCCT0042]MBR1296659.1 hypothetical protein [Bradyrhizobium sp. AUGA SZCCT0042]
MNKRVFKTDGLSLEDVVKLKKAALEQERQDAMFEAENLDLMPDPDIKLTYPRASTKLTEAEKESILNERLAATYFWPEIIHVPGATVEEKAAYITAHKAQIRPRLLPKLLLDLVVDITPLDKPPPKMLIALLREALGLPKKHEVGGWVFATGMRNDQGRRDHEGRKCASNIDLNYLDPLLTHKDKATRSEAVPMPLNELKRRVDAKLGRKIDRKSLREWRQDLDYWNLTQLHRQAQVGCRGK